MPEFESNSFFVKKLEVVKSSAKRLEPSKTFLTREQIDRAHSRLQTLIDVRICTLRAAGLDPYVCTLRAAGLNPWVGMWLEDGTVAKEVRRHSKITRLYLLLDAVSLGKTDICKVLIDPRAGNCNPYEYVDRDKCHDTNGVMPGAKKVCAFELALFMNKPDDNTLAAMHQFSSYRPGSQHAPASSMIAHLFTKLNYSDRSDWIIGGKLDELMSPLMFGLEIITDDVWKTLIRRRAHVVICRLIERHRVPPAIEFQSPNDPLYETKKLYPSFEYAKIESEKLCNAPARSIPMELALKQVSCCSLVEKQKVKFKNPECAICLSHMVPGHTIATTRCQHTFHHACLKEVYEQNIGTGNPLCPYCRTPINYNTTEGNAIGVPVEESADVEKTIAEGGTDPLVGDPKSHLNKLLMKVAKRPLTKADVIYRAGPVEGGFQARCEIVFRRDTYVGEVCATKKDAVSSVAQIILDDLQEERRVWAQIILDDLQQEGHVWVEPGAIARVTA